MNPGPTRSSTFNVQRLRFFLGFGSSKEFDRCRFGPGDRRGDRRGWEVSGAGEGVRDRLARVVSGTRKSAASCDVSGVAGSSWTFGITGGGSMA